MVHLRSTGSRRQSGTAGVSKQVQHPHGAAGVCALLPDKIPVSSLLREYTGVLEVHGLDIKRQIILVSDLPAIRQLMLGPVTAAGIGADITGIVALPFRRAVRGVPDDLGIGPHQNVLAPALQALAVGRIQNPIIFPR